MAPAPALVTRPLLRSIDLMLAWGSLSRRAHCLASSSAGTSTSTLPSLASTALILSALLCSALLCSPVASSPRRESGWRQGRRRSFALLRLLAFPFFLCRALPPRNTRGIPRPSMLCCFVSPLLLSSQRPSLSLSRALCSVLPATCYPIPLSNNRPTAPGHPQIENNVPATHRAPRHRMSQNKSCSLQSLQHYPERVTSRRRCRQDYPPANASYPPHGAHG